MQNSATKLNEQEIKKLTLDLDEKQKQITKLIKRENLNSKEIDQIVEIINNLTSIIYDSDGMKDQINELFLIIEQKDQEYKTLKESYIKVADENQNLKIQVNLLQNDQDATKVTVQQLLEEVSNLKNDFNDKNLEVKNQIDWHFD